ncbi:alpha/beta fold hydrolase [Nocardia sp. NPDC004123]
MPYVTTDEGTTVHYLGTETDGPALVLGHGFFMDGEMWLPQLEGLADRYRAIAVDVRGHGRTEDAGNPFTYWDLAWMRGRSSSIGTAPPTQLSRRWPGLQPWPHARARNRIGRSVAHNPAKWI